jgi:protein ImuA
MGITAPGGFPLPKGLSPSLQDIVRAHSTPPPRAVLPSGLADIDARLPFGGLELALHEIAPADHQSLPAALGFLLALTQLAAAKRKGALFWPLKRGGSDFGRPYAPGLKYFGCDPGRFLFARCATALDAQWAMEEALRAGSVAAVLGERMAKTTLTMSRRLQLAAEETGTPIFLLRGVTDDTPSAARTRWRIAAHPAGKDRFGLPGCASWHVALERTRGGSTGEWILEWDHDALCLGLPSLLADRTVPAGEARKSA